MKKMMTVVMLGMVAVFVGAGCCSLCKKAEPAKCCGTCKAEAKCTACGMAKAECKCPATK